MPTTISEMMLPAIGRLREAGIRGIPSWPAGRNRATPLLTGLVVAAWMWVGWGAETVVASAAPVRPTTATTAVWHGYRCGQCQANVLPEMDCCPGCGVSFLDAPANAGVPASERFPRETDPMLVNVGIAATGGLMTLAMLTVAVTWTGRRKKAGR